MLKPKDKKKKLFCFGYGYSARHLAEIVKKQGWEVYGTTTDEEKVERAAEQGIHLDVFEETQPLYDPYTALKDITHILVSIPPHNNGDLVYDMHGIDIASMPNLEWFGYLSNITLYGNRDGQWVDENATPAPTSKRGSQRLRAEEQWLHLYDHEHIPLHIFRLAGIYGPGRSAIDSVRSGTARRIDKPDHAFNRIHVDDIVQTLIASMNNPNPGSIYNVADDDPAPSHEVIKYACELLKMEVPELIPFSQVDMAPIVRSFYKENKRIKNEKIKDELGVKLLHPNYKRGLEACLKAEG